MSGRWLLPTKGRTHQISRFFEAWRKTAANTPGWLLVDDDDTSDYSVVALPENWSIVRGTSSCVADAVNTAWLAAGFMKGEAVDWIGLLCDDHIPETMEWDRLLIERVKLYNIVASANGSQEKRLHGALVYGGKLLSAVGWIYPPGIKHSFHDDAWELVAERCLNLVKCDDVMVRHAHAGTVDETGRKRNTYWNEDERAYLKWRSDYAPTTIKLVLGLMKAEGVNVAAPILTDRSVMICTPCYSGSYKRQFVMSIQNTLDLMRALGIKVEWCDAPNIAEPSFARAIIHGRFVKSSYSDLVMIDDDMSWSPRDLIRLLNAPYDLIGVAGPRKLDHPAFAAHITRADADQMLMDEAHAAMRVTSLGGAFVRITRRCAEKMVAAYPDLAFEQEHGAIEYDLFNPMIVERDGKRTRLGEDYTYCERARKIGIYTMAIIDISLGHVGEKEWRGALVDILRQPPQASAAAE